MGIALVSDSAADIEPISVQSSVIKQLALSELVAYLRHGRVDYLINAGLSPQMLDQLRNMDLQDFAELIEADQIKVHLRFDITTLQRGMTTLTQAKRQRLLLEYFIQNGASADMLERYFKVSQKVVTEFREMLRVKIAVGRPRQPPLDEKLTIQHEWGDLCERVADPRIRFQALHARYRDYSLATLSAVVQEA